MRAAALDHGAEPASPERGERGIDRHRPGSPGHLRHQLARLAVPGDGEIAGACAQRGAGGRGVGDDRQGRVVRNVQPLVRVDRPRVCPLHAVDEVAERRRGGGPETERSVDVDPACPALTRCRRDLAHGVEGARVDVAGLRADQGRAGFARQCLGQGVRAHRALAVHRNAFGAARTEARHPQRVQQRGMHLLAHQDPHAGRSGQPVRLDVPPGVGEQAVARRDDPDQVARGGARREADGRVDRQAERLEDPPLRDCVDGRSGRRGRAREDVLVPARDEPVRGQCRREAPAGNEAEVARPGARHGGRPDGGGELFDHRLGRRALLGQRPVEPRQRLLVARERSDAPVADPVEVLLGELRGAPEQGHRLRRRSGGSRRPIRCRARRRYAPRAPCRRRA